MAAKFVLPFKAITYLKRLQLENERVGRGLQHDILNDSRVYVREETSHDNWNGGTYGHDVVLFVPVEVMRRVPLDAQGKLEEEIVEALRKCASGFSNEFFNAVSLEMEDENDSEFQQAIPFAGRASINPDALTIWKLGFVRLFITHRDLDKQEANLLADALEGYGISSFVALDTIEPMEKWEHEILRGLETMEVMLVFLTDRFHESVWTNQEIGFALARGIPIISLKLERTDPKGFISASQALRGRIDRPEDSAPEVYRLIAQKLGQKARLQRALISAFANSRSYIDAKERFDRLEGCINTVTDEELNELLASFAANDQLHGAGYLGGGRFKSFLERVSGKQFERQGKKYAFKEELTDEIPF